MNTFGLAVRYFFIDLLGGIIRWPIWWYTKGLIGTFRWAAEAVQGYGKTLGINIWIKNIFVPMYGTRDWQSRIISFFFRVVQIIGRSIALFVWMFVVAFLVLFYIALPIFSVIMALVHVSAFFA